MMPGKAGRAAGSDPSGAGALAVRDRLHNAAARLEHAGVEDARLEAEILLAHALGVDRSRVLAMMPERPSDAAAVRFDALVARRLGREPLAYITGHREFYGVDLLCEPGVLIPRPETELLVELALADVRQRTGVARVCDVGTGSGAIAIAIALQAANVDVTAIDSSPAARSVARRNAERHAVTPRVRVVDGDLLAGTGRFDVIVANLPYVSAAEMRALPPEIACHEPVGALLGGSQGTELNMRLLAEAPQHLAPGGLLVLEFGSGQAAVSRSEAAKAFPVASIVVHNDLAGLERVLAVKLRGADAPETGVR